LYQRVATLKAQSLERETTVTAAQTDAARQLARERLTNLKVESRLEALRLQVVEAKLAQAPKIAELDELNHRILEGRTQVSRALVDQLERRYQELGEIQERELKRAAAIEESKAKQADNPLERYRSRRLSELLDLEAKVLKNEQALATSTRPTLEESRSLADRAANDFAQIKQLLDDGNVSRLDALRLNNDFRRIGPERDRLLKNELGSIEAQLQFYENTLTEVELELIEESVADQVEHEAVLERLTVDRQDAARKEFADLESKHRALLERRRAALTKLVARASETMEQVTRRLNVLEDEYGFIRTHIFWVRDQEPLGFATMTQSGRELRRLLRSFLKLAGEISDPASWGRPSTEFMTTAMAVLVLPLGLFRIRRSLRRRITRALPPSHLHGTTAATIRVDMSAAIGQR
jgi:potassium efflux system protein